MSMNVKSAWDIFIKDEQKYIILYFKEEKELEVACCAKWVYAVHVSAVRANARDIKHAEVEIPVALIENVIFNWL